MFEWFSGLITGLSRKMNRGMVVCVGFGCVASLPWAPASEGFRLAIALLLISGLMGFLGMSYGYSRKSSSEPRNAMDEERHEERSEKESSEN